MGEIISVLVAAYGYGFAVAAPMGPVNMYAIRRGIVGGWGHTLACGLGSALMDLAFFGLALQGGRLLILWLNAPVVRVLLAAAGAAVLFPLAVMLLLKAKRGGDSRMAQVGQDDALPPTRLRRDFVAGIVLTFVNPAGVAYWLFVASTWLPAGETAFKSPWVAVWWGMLAAAAGLVSWFVILSAMLRFVPERIGPLFFRIVNAVCGLALLAFGVACLVFMAQQHL